VAEPLPAGVARLALLIRIVAGVLADLRDGSLKPVLTDYRIANAGKELVLVYAGRRHISAKTRSFVDFSVDWFRSNADHLTSADSHANAAACCARTPAML